MQQLPPTARLIGIGWYFVVCIVGGLGGGVLLDRLIDSRPILTMIGLLLGLFFAFYGGYHMLIEALKTNQRPKE